MAHRMLLVVPAAALAARPAAGVPVPPGHPPGGRVVHVLDRHTAERQGRVALPRRAAGGARGGARALECGRRPARAAASAARHAMFWVRDSTLPSGSLIHATRAPLGERQTPVSSCGSPA